MLKLVIVVGTKLHSYTEFNSTSGLRLEPDEAPGLKSQRLKRTSTERLRRSSTKKPTVSVGAFVFITGSAVVPAAPQVGSLTTHPTRSSPGWVRDLSP